MKITKKIRALTAKAIVFPLEVAAFPFDVANLLFNTWDLTTPSIVSPIENMLVGKDQETQTYYSRIGRKPPQTTPDIATKQIWKHKNHGGKVSIISVIEQDKHRFIEFATIGSTSICKRREDVFMNWFNYESGE